MRSSIICLSIILFVCLVKHSMAQRIIYVDTIKLQASREKIKSISTFASIAAHRVYMQPLLLLPANHYAKTAGFFCKKEIEIDKASRVPLRFRLGSVAYTDKMEGKNSYRPPLNKSH